MQFSKTCLENGRGGRTRTYAWRDQNPLPYHLATPLERVSHCNATEAILKALID